MPNISSGKNDSGKNTSSGHGALGMGGQPNDDPRDLAGGGEGRENSDLGGGTGPVPGASGDAVGSPVEGGTGASQVTGPMGDAAATPDVDAALRKSRPADDR